LAGAFTETSFGRVSIVRFILVAMIVVLIAVQAKSPGRQLNWPSAALSGGLAASLAGVGHTQLEDRIYRLVHTMADGLHLLAAGAWLGGLVPPFHLVAKSLGTVSPAVDAEARNAALRFSGMGYVAVATLDRYRGRNVDFVPV
jgi:copper resistance protein D